MAQVTLHDYKVNALWKHESPGGTSLHYLQG